MVSHRLVLLTPAILYAITPPWYHPRRSSNHGEKEEEKEDTGPETTGPLDPYAADHLRRNRGDRDRILHPQPGRVRRRQRSLTLIIP